METQKLKTAFLGIAEKDQALLEAAWKNKLFEVVALAGDNPDLVANFAGRYECVPFDDYRQLVVRNQLDLLVVTAPMHLCEEHVRTAMKKKIKILKLAPPALDFEQTAEFMKIARKNKTEFFVANPMLFCSSFAELPKHIRTQDKSQIYLICCFCNTPTGLDEPAQRWLNDPKVAGGGVLLRDCYYIIDLIVLNFGLPQQVYCLTTNQAPDKQQRLSITEDTVTVLMKFSDTLIGSLTGSRRFGPGCAGLTIHGRQSYMTFTNDSFTIHDNCGTITQQQKFDYNPDESIEKMLHNIASTMLQPDKKQANARARNLMNMALIEAAYLSARTAMPEEPLKVLEMAATASTGI
jgi:predicted dehydrogenase